jgi:hypothetical protein
LAVLLCGEDTRIHLYIHFETDKDEIFNGNERGALKKIDPAKYDVLSRSAVSI